MLIIIVTTLFADDNWGNIRALLPYNHNHTGGGGVYYHADCEYSYLKAETVDETMRWWHHFEKRRADHRRCRGPDAV